MTCEQRTLAVVALLALVGAAVGELPLLNVSGFTWAENLAFDVYPGQSQLFVSDAYAGEIWRLVLAPSGQAYVRQLLVRGGGIKGVDGLSMNGDSTVLYANARFDNGSTVVLAVDPASGAWQPLAALPNMGNGLAFDARTGFLYATYEANEVPGRGAVYAVDTQGEYPVAVVASGLQSSDGCRIDVATNTLYVSNVVEARLDLFALPVNRSAPPALRRLRSFRAPGMKSLDDFAVDGALGLIWGADFLAGNVVRFNADGSGQGLVVATGLTNPTSVQIGAGADFNATSIYVTEGGGVLPIQHNRRVLEFRGQVPVV